MAELSKRSGVGVSTIKFYLREGLLPPGERTLANQAQYGNGHLVRLQLIRALSEVGRLSLAEIGGVLSVLDRGGAPIDALATLREKATADCVIEAPTHRASSSLDALFGRLGWAVDKSSPAYQSAVHALGALAIVDGEEPTEEQLEALARAAVTVVDHDTISRMATCVHSEDSAGSEDGGAENREDDYYRLLVGAMRRDQLLSALVLLATESQLAQQSTART